MERRTGVAKLLIFFLREGTRNLDIFGVTSPVVNVGMFMETAWDSDLQAASHRSHPEPISYAA